MALNHIRYEKEGGKEYGVKNRSCLFMRVLYAKEYAKKLKDYHNATAEVRSQMKTPSTPPEKEWQKIYHFLSRYRLLLEHEYSFDYGHRYTLKISDNGLRFAPPRLSSHAYAVQDLGSIMNFLNDYYGLTKERCSNFIIWRKYHRLKKVAFYSPADLGEKLVRLCRELYYKYDSQTYLDNPNCAIGYYEINFESSKVSFCLNYNSKDKNQYSAMFDL